MDMEWSVEAPFHLKFSCVLHTESGPVPGKAGCCPRRQVCHEIPSRFDLFGTAIHANLEHSGCARDLFQFDLLICLLFTFWQCSISNFNDPNIADYLLDPCRAIIF